ncbi:MAG: hypothetical protein AAAFM81_08855 [Pseudomonadota bacterium]
MKRFEMFLAAIGLVLTAYAIGSAQSAQAEQPMTKVIVAGSSVADVRYHVESLGGEVTGEIVTINAVTAKLDLSTVQKLREGGYGLSIFVDDTETVSMNERPDRDGSALQASHNYRS